jgi:hypothetical protein
LNDLGFWEAFFLCVDGGVFDAEIEQITSVFGIEYRVVRIVTDRSSMTPQHEIRDAMKCSAPYTMDVLRSRQSFDASQHLARRPIRECREHDPLRRNALLDEISDSISDRPRLTRACTGHNERGFRLRSHNAKLLLVQLAFVTSQSLGQTARSAF